MPLTGTYIIGSFTPDQQYELRYTYPDVYWRIQEPLIDEKMRGSWLDPRPTIATTPSSGNK